MTEKVGLQSVWDNSQFNAGNAEYVKKVLDATKTTEDSAKRFGVAWNASANRWQTAQGKFISGATAAEQVLAKLGDATKAPDGGLSKLGQTVGGGLLSNLLSMGKAAGGSALGGLAALGGVMGATIAVTQSLITAVTSAISTIQKFGAESIQTAGRVQELTIVSQLLGQRAGLTSQEVTAEVQAIKDVGIQTDVANLLFAQFARYQLDTAQASDLARVAQDAAVLSMQNSSDALQDLLRGVLTYNKETLRNAGLNVDIQASFEAYAATLGKTAEALTEQERVQATLNAVLAEGANIQGVYAAAMESPAKQARSLSRIIFELKNALGQPFLSAWGNVIGMVTNFVKTLAAAVSEGGVLYPILVNLGAVADLVTSGLANMAGVATEAGTSFLSALIERLGTAASQAYTWGANIVIQLATGIINGAGNAIIAAMNYISQLLSHWLAPGSPPLVAPDLVDWGINAVSQFLSGFTKGDFSVLKAIQSPLKSALDTLADMGTLGKDEAGQMFADLSKNLIEQLNSGQVDESFFTDLANSTGVFGEEIAELARRQLELAGAEQEVADAEGRLAAAREAEARAGAKVNTLTLEYNQALRSGATKEQLKERMAAINAAKQEQALASQQAADAEQQLEDSKSNLDVLREQAQLQNDLVQQLLELARAQIETPEPAPPEPPAPPGGAGGGLPEGGPGLPEIDPGGFTDPITAAVDSAKEAILNKLRELWDALKAQIQQGMGEVATRFAEAWNRLKEALGPVWERIKEIVGLALEWIAGEVQYWLDFAREWWDRHGESVKTVWNGLWAFLKGVVQGAIAFIGGLIQRGLDWFRGFWERHGEQIKERWGASWETLKTVVGNALEIIGNYFDFWAAIFTGDWQTAWDELKAIWNLAWESLKLVVSTAFENIKTSYSIFAAEMMLFWSTLWEGLKTKAGEIWDAIVLYTQTKLGEAQTFISTKLTEISTTWTEIWTAVQTKVQEIWDAIKTYVEEKIALLFEKMGLDMDAMKERWSEIWEDVKEIAAEVWDRIVEAVSDKVESVRGTVEGKVTDLQSWWNTTWTSISDKVAEIWQTIHDAVEEKLQGVYDYVEAKVVLLKYWWGEWWEDIRQKVTDVWDGMITKVQERVQTIYDDVTGKIQEIYDWINGKVSEFTNVGKNIIDGLIDGMLTSAGRIVEIITQAVENAIAAAKAALGIDSPSKVFIEIGGFTMEGFAQGVTQMAKQAAGAMTTAMQGTVNASVKAIPLPYQMAPLPFNAGSTSSTLNMNMTNYVNNGMDMAALEAFIIRTVKKGMRA